MYRDVCSANVDAAKQCPSVSLGHTRCYVHTLKLGVTVQAVVVPELHKCQLLIPHRALS